MSYAKRLDKLGDQWKKDKPATGGGGLPAGNYQFEIKRAVLEEAKAAFNKGHVQVVLYLEVITGPAKGRKNIKWIDLQQPAKDAYPSGISIFKKLLQDLGLDIPASLGEKDLNRVLKELVGMVVEGAVVINKNGRPTTYINRAINAASASEDDEDETDDEDESEDDEDEDESEDADEDDDEEDDEEEAKPAPATKSNAKSPAKPAKKGAKTDDSEFDDWE